VCERASGGAVVPCQAAVGEASREWNGGGRRFGVNKTTG
jgi:hypothetical protein